MLEKKLTSTDDITIDAAGTCVNDALVQAADDVSISADTSIITGFAVTATGGDLTLTSTGVITTSGDTLTAGSDVNVNGAGILTLDAINATDAVSVTGALQVNTDGTVSGDTVSIESTTADLDIDNTVTSTVGAVTLIARTDFDAADLITGADNVTITATQTAFKIIIFH